MKMLKEKDRVMEKIYYVVLINVHGGSVIGEYDTKEKALARLSERRKENIDAHPDWEIRYDKEDGFDYCEPGNPDNLESIFIEECEID